MIEESPAILLRAKSHGEGAAVVTFFTEEFGLLKGFIRGIKKRKADLQVGAIGNLTRKRRLESQLGTITWEVKTNPAAVNMENIKNLQVIKYVAEVLGKLLPEEHSYPSFYHATNQFLMDIKLPDLLERLVMWELRLLASTGYGLSLMAEGAVPCNSGTPLMYVSPNTGRAVTAAKGEPYKEKLLLLPEMLGGIKAPSTKQDLQNALKLTGYFINIALESKSVASREELMENIL